MIKLRAEVARGTDYQTEGNHWSEFVADLWNDRLPHLREETYGEGEFIFDPSTGRYGFEDQSEYGSEDDLFMADLESEDRPEEVIDDAFGIDLAAVEEDSFAVVVESVGQSQVTHSYDLAQSTDEEEDSDLEEVSGTPPSQPKEEDLAREFRENVYVPPRIEYT